MQSWHLCAPCLVGLKRALIRSLRSKNAGGIPPLTIHHLPGLFRPCHQSPVAGAFYGSQIQIQCLLKQRSDRGKDKLCHGVALTCVRVLCCPCTAVCGTTATLEAAMFLATKVHVISGMVIGVFAVMAAKQMRKQRRMCKHSYVPTNAPQN